MSAPAVGSSPFYALNYPSRRHFPVAVQRIRRTQSAIPCKRPARNLALATNTVTRERVEYCSSIADRRAGAVSGREAAASSQRLSGEGRVPGDQTAARCATRLDGRRRSMDGRWGMCTRPLAGSSAEQPVTNLPALSPNSAGCVPPSPAPGRATACIGRALRCCCWWCALQWQSLPAPRHHRRFPLPLGSSAPKQTAGSPCPRCGRHPSALQS